MLVVLCVSATAEGTVLAATRAETTIVSYEALVESGSRRTFYDEPFRLIARVSSDREISRVEARLYAEGASDPALSLTDFTRTSASDGTSVWRSDRYVDPPVAKYRVEISAVDADGTRTDRVMERPLHKRLKINLVEVTTDRSHADVEHPDVTVTGRLVHIDGEGTRQPVSEARVNTGNADGSTAVTNPDGRFNLRTRIAPENPSLYLWTSPGAPYGEAYHTVNAGYRLVSTRLFAEVSGSGVIGEKLLVRGRLRRWTGNGVGTGIAGMTVVLQFWEASGRAGVAHPVKTDADGDFEFSTITTGVGEWRAYFNNHGAAPEAPGYERGFARASTPAAHRTAVSGMTFAAQPTAAGDRLTVKAQIRRLKADATWSPVSAGPMSLLFSPDGKRWGVEANGLTGPQGFVSISARVPRDGFWRLDYDPEFGNDFSARSAVRYVNVKHRTSITGFDASPEPVKKGRMFAVQGQLKQYFSGTWKPLSGATVHVYFKANGTSKWTRMAAVKTGRYGGFHKPLKASRDGAWLVTYQGDSSCLGVRSASDYVDVR
ncbi:hypothetical protein ACH34W_22710 [Actinomadura sp. 6N118]